MGFFGPILHHPVRRVRTDVMKTMYVIRFISLALLFAVEYTPVRSGHE
jgi:hypothetical protein